MTIEKDASTAEYYAVSAPALQAIASPELIEAGEGDVTYVVAPELVERIANGAAIPRLYGLSADHGERFDCDVSELHRTHRWIERADQVVMTGDEPLTPFIIHRLNTIPLVNETLAKQLIERRLLGMRIRPAPMNSANMAQPFREPVFLLSGPEPLPTVPRRLDPAFSNKCPFCGYGPVFCPSCGYVSNPCPSCKKHVLRRRSDHPDYERQLDDRDAFPPNLNAAAGAIDLRRCERRWDFSGVADFSRQAVEFLLEVGAYPLEIEPLKVLFEDGRLGYTRNDAILFET